MDVIPFWTLIRNICGFVVGSLISLRVGKTHIILADLTDKVEDFIHGSRRWSEHRKCLLVHLIYCHPSKRQINSFSIKLKPLYTISGLFPTEQVAQYLFVPAACEGCNRLDPRKVLVWKWALAHFLS